MKLLITGANGLLGQKIVTLTEGLSNLQVIATSRGKNRNPKGRYAYRHLDVTDNQAVYDLLKKELPDVIINCAAMTQVDQCETDRENCWSQNVTAVAHLVEGCDAINAFLIHLSTDFIFDGLDGPYTEEATPNPLSYYGESKWAAENLLTNSPINLAIVRTVLVYGIAHDMSRSNLILWVKDNLEQGNKIRAINDQWRTPTLAEDLAAGCWAIAQQSATGIFNVSGKDLLTPYDMAIQTATFFGLDESLIEEVDGTVFTQPAKRPAKTGFILEKAQRVLDYAPHSFHEGLELLAQQLKSR